MTKKELESRIRSMRNVIRSMRKQTIIEPFPHSPLVQCEFCVYYEDNYNQNGICRRRSPEVVRQIASEMPEQFCARWPVVRKDDCCGDGERNHRG